MRTNQIPFYPYKNTSKLKLGKRNSTIGQIALRQSINHLKLKHALLTGFNEYHQKWQSKFYVIWLYDLLGVPPLPWMTYHVQNLQQRLTYLTKELNLYTIVFDLFSGNWLNGDLKMTPQNENIFKYQLLLTSNSKN